MSSDSKKPAGGHACCHEDREKDHSPVIPSKTAGKYFCPMCDGVVSDKPGACPMCGMALERNPAYVEKKTTVYTCPMHPEHPGRTMPARWCPICCGMALEPVKRDRGFRG